MEKMCYVVECSSGQYDDYRWWISGIFDNAFDAESLKKEIDKNIEIVRNIPEPFELNIDEVSDEQYEVYSKWQTENMHANEFNSSQVVEYPFNKPIKPLN